MASNRRASQHIGPIVAHRFAESTSIADRPYDAVTTLWTLDKKGEPRSLWRETGQPLVNLGQHGKFEAYRHTWVFSSIDKELGLMPLLQKSYSESAFKQSIQTS